MKKINFILALLLLSSPVWATSTEQPTSTETVTNDGNTSCDDVVHSVVDEGADSPGGDWCTADDNNTSWTIVVEFDTPSGSADTSTDAQAFEYYVRSFDEGQTSDPTIQIDVMDGTACADVHETGTSTTLTDAGFPAKVTDNWTASGISGTADICARLVCTKTGGSPSARNSCDVDAIEWEFVSAAAATTPIYSIINLTMEFLNKIGIKNDFRIVEKKRQTIKGEIIHEVAQTVSN